MNWLKKNRSIRASLAGILLASMLPVHQSHSAQTFTEQEAYEVAMEAYVYFYPLITMDVTRSVMTNLPSGVKEGFGPMNAFHHFRTFPRADFRDVVRPNFDTLYSPAWIDLTNGPVVVSVPNTDNRYYLLPMLDMWSDVFAAPGKRTSGTRAAHYLIVPPGWNGIVPKDFERIDAPTKYVWIIGRTQTNGPEDYESVHKVQNGYKITPLSSWGKEEAVTKFVLNAKIDMRTEPLMQVNRMPAEQYFAYGVTLMNQHSPHITDWSQISRLGRIGIELGKDFDFSKADPIVQAALRKAVVDGLTRIRSFMPRMARVENGWQMNTDTMGVYGNFYLKRATVALMGLGANQPQDAVYPTNLTDADGKPLMGGSNYVIHGKKGQLCPVEAFCSLTMYDAEGFQVANPINRFAIGDRDKLKFNSDGSIDIYIQPNSPGVDKESNWLPSPADGKLGLTMRLYAPKAEVLDGSWAPPVVKRIQ